MDRSAWAAVAGVLVGWAALLPAVSLGPEVVYAQDGAWIHLSVAHHWVDDGVWGISPVRTSAASSSPAWTALVALGLALTELGDLVPYALQAPILVLLALLTARWLAPLPGPTRTVTALGVLVGAGLPALLLTSMEHALHALVALALVDATGRAVDEPPGPRRQLTLAAVAAAAMVTRPETVFLLVGTGACLARAGRWSALVAGHGAAVISAATMGAWYTHTGVGPLPNAVYAKSALGPAASLQGAVGSALGGLPGHLASHDPLTLAAVASLLVAALVTGRGHHDGRVRAGLWGLVAAVVLQVAFARLGSLARYESWLIVLGLAVAGRAWAHGGATTGPTRALLVATAGVLCTRVALTAQASLLSLGAMAGGELAAARVLAGAFTGESVVADEAGAISFHARVEVIDPLGLADNQVLRLRRAGAWGPASLERMAASRGAAVAVLHLDRFEGGEGVPSSWTPVATWSVPHGRPLTWYAIDAPPERVRQALKRTPPPRTTTVRWRCISRRSRP